MRVNEFETGLVKLLSDRLRCRRVDPRRWWRCLFGGMYEREPEVVPSRGAAAADFLTDMFSIVTNPSWPSTVITTRSAVSVALAQREASASDAEVILRR